jgi:hypothetical protein
MTSGVVRPDATEQKKRVMVHPGGALPDLSQRRAKIRRPEEAGRELS